jgi:hypothetical protein
MGTTGMALSNAMACGSTGGNVWYQVTFPSAQDLEVDATPSAGGDTVLLARDGCMGNDLVCDDDFSFSSRASRIWIRGTPGAAGVRTVWVSVLAFSAATQGPFMLQASVSPAAPPGVCGGPLFDLTRGGAVAALSPTRTSMTLGTCSPRPSGTEDIYQYAGPAGTVRFVATTTAFTPSLYVRTTCGGPTDIACRVGNPSTINLASAGAMMYVFVDGAPGTPAFYNIEAVAP